MIRIDEMIHDKLQEFLAKHSLDEDGQIQLFSLLEEAVEHPNSLPSAMRTVLANEHLPDPGAKLCTGVLKE